MARLENPAVSRIIGHEIVRKHFGYWPNFHDAVITETIFKVNSPSLPTATFLIESCETLNEVEAGYYKQVKHCEIKLQFVGIQKMVCSFDHQPVIFDLSFEESGGFIECFIGSSAKDAFIVAEKVIVKSLTPTKQ
ncbi:Imm50 family immunity protein [Hymenobacter lucidus]|uniref:Immunity 50 family protein n=1 Tax=Hymenobacter lucidus TaxID=2880930 RepID=A0ABS8AUN7_9BACT|nr:Imm50 family immunity protein [Hymenobacter lucidus]MCB2409708.1 immunity 50 family protein [Hymenobacter lucidus]